MNGSRRRRALRRRDPRRPLDQGRLDSFVRTNCFGTNVLCDVARQVGRRQRFLHISTDEVYGSIEEGSFSETDPLGPRSPYSAAKAGSDLIALSYHTTHGLPVVVTRCSNNYGPYQFPEKVIPLFTTNLLDGKKVPLYGDGGNVRDWIHVARPQHRGATSCCEQGNVGEIYNIGAGNEITNKELTYRLLELCGRDESFIEPVADRLGHDRRYSITHDKVDRARLAAASTTSTTGLADDRRLVPRQPGVVGAAEGAGRALMRVLVTGRSRAARPRHGRSPATRAGDEVLGVDRAAARHHRPRRRARRDHVVRARRRRQLRGLDRGRRVRGRPRPGARCATASPCGCLAEALRPRRCAPRARQHRLRVRRHARPPVPRVGRARTPSRCTARPS